LLEAQAGYSLIPVNRSPTLGAFHSRNSAVSVRPLISPSPYLPSPYLRNKMLRNHFVDLGLVVKGYAGWSLTPLGRREHVALSPKYADFFFG